MIKITSAAASKAVTSSVIKLFYKSLLCHFSKNGSSWIGGIENVYHDPCQDWIDLVNMKLTSPNYPSKYDPLEDCTWVITAPQGHYITLDFVHIEVIIRNNLQLNISM